MRAIDLAAVAVLVLAAGCGEAEPVVSVSRDADIYLASDTADNESDPPQDRQVAVANSEPKPPRTSSSAVATTPPPTAGVAPTTPTTRPAAISSTTTPPTVAPATPSNPGETTAVAGIIEFRIPSGTQSNPWNTFDNPVRVTVGQTLRIYNDDVIAHTVHSNGAPFAHGPTIQPGEYADHSIVQTLTPDQAYPVNYDHDAGVTAPLWVIAQPPQSNDAAPGPTELVAAEAESLRLLNDLRNQLGVQPVTPSDPEMHAFARAWSLEMRNTGFRHSNPPPWFENIVWYSDQTMTPTQAAAQFHDMWINSPGHYENMTKPDWSIVGIGMWHDETGWWGVHVFR